MTASPNHAPGLAVRLILTLTGAMAVVWVIAAIIAYFTLTEELGEVMDSTLRETAESLVPLADLALTQEHLNLPLTFDTIRVTDDDHEEYIVYQIRDAETGALLMRSHDAPDQAFPKGAAQGFLTTDHYRIYSGLSNSGHVLVQVADPLEHRQDAAEDTIKGLFAPLVVLLPFTAVVILWSVRRSLSPIKLLQTAIGARDGDSLEPLGLGGLPLELQPIAQSVDRLLERIRLALETEKTFAANSAHELRTPIAGALAQTQRLTQELPEGKTRERAEAIETALQRLKNLCDKLLQMSRADASQTSPPTPIAILPVLDTVIEDLQRSEPGADRLSLDLADGVEPHWPIDIDGLGLILRNLLENAIRHGAQEEPVLIRLTPSGTLQIVNGGPAIPAQRFDALRRAFIRGNTEAKGAGLGLSIVETLIGKSLLTMQMESPVPGRSEGVLFSLKPKKTEKTAVS